MSEYRPNSDRAREEQQAEKRTEKVVTGEVTQRKKSGLSRLAGDVLSGDFRSVGSYLLTDVLIPSAKRMISDVVCNGVNMLLGEPNRSPSGTPASKVSYRAYYDREKDRPDYAQSKAYSYDDIIFKNRSDAEEVLLRMEELVDRFGAVRVADLFDMAGKSCNYTDNKYGWTNLRDAYIEYVRDGYRIHLPRATSL